MQLIALSAARQIRRFMHLRALKLNGFKSFADAIELKFEPGVTAIVGPNGCGKSNIADAVRWVLGEQSAKALRGGKMHDVIFEGTDRRKPVPMCEVSLLLTDCEKELGVEFNEIEVTRRVSRDGGSDYLINGRACRLKDIQKLFMDTGVGRTSYSIMAQGQIDQILSSKPEERRAVFEEAAGITKYKTQRREALNKLALVDQNLSRVTDVINEVGRQITSLRRQASKALRYRRLSHRLRHLDLGQSGRNFEAISTSIKGLEAALGERSGNMQQFQQDLAQKETDLAACKSERSTYLQRVQEAQQAVFDLRSQREQALNEAHLADVRATGLDDRIAQARDELASVERQLGELVERADASAQDKELQLGVLGDSDEVFQSRNRELVEIDERLKRSEERLQQLKYGLLEAESALVRLRNDCSNLEVEDRTAQARAERLNEEFAEQEQAEQQARAACEEARRHRADVVQRQADAEQAIVAAQEELGRLGREFKQQHVRIQELDRAIAQKTARHKLLQQLQERFEGYGDGAKAMLQGRVGGAFSGRAFKALTADLKVDTDYVRAVEALLGAAVEAVLVDDSATARAVMEHLAQQELGRACLHFPAPEPHAPRWPELPAGIQPAVSVVDGDNQPAAALLAGCLIADSSEAFFSFWQSNPELEFALAATPGGELIDRRGLLLGGQQQSQSGILQRVADIKAIAVEIETDGTRLGNERQEAEKIGAQLTAAEQALDQKRREHVEVTQQAATVATEERNAQKQLHDVEARRGRLEREREVVTDTHQRATERLGKARGQFSEGEARVNQLRGEIDEIDKVLVTLRGERDVRREAVAQARFDLAEKRQRLEVLDRGLAELAARRSALEENKQARELEIENWTSQIEELKTTAAKQRQRAGECARTLEVSQGSVASARAELVKIEERLQLLESEQAFLREQTDGMRSDVSKIEIELAEKRARVQFLHEEVTREHQVELESIDWRYEMWLAGQQPRGLRALDLDEEGERTEGEDDSSAIENAPAEEAVSTDEPVESQPTHEELEALENTDWDAVKTEVQTLRQRLHSMGPVNLVAIEEYGELKQRFEFLKTQSDDLVNSKEALLKAIDEINRTSQQQFADTFEQIRRNFAQTFNTLFGGGHADLRLMESEDVLESGIEIVAQPPGTRLRGISLLSGGQRTMTAVGLLFAIYMVKPSPFCVLDELDAPLDESNIGRFTTLLRQFTVNSQFIIITHNKRTISASQSIYGVTMEERGVSKVVSMRFHAEHHEAEFAQLAMAPGVPAGAGVE